MKVIVDTGFLSSLAKIKRLNLILKFFEIDYFIIPKQVLKELKNSRIFEDILDYISIKKAFQKGEFIRVENHTLMGEYKGIGKGEAACIEICEKEDIILMDDRQAKDHAHKEGKACFDLPTFLYACKKKEIIDSEELKEIIRELGEKDYYEFEKEIKKMLLEG